MEAPIENKICPLRIYKPYSSKPYIPYPKNNYIGMKNVQRYFLFLGRIKQELKKQHFGLLTS
jgi:hypothetical protein